MRREETHTNARTNRSGPDENGSNLNADVARKISEVLRRGSPAYNATLRSLQWQRDNYLMGNYYADKRQKAREPRPNKVFLPKINYVKIDPSAMGNIQIAQLGAWFIPSPTVKKALMPIVLEQPRGTLYQPALRGLVSLIDSQQANVDALLKSSVLDLLEHERLRKLVMNSTKGYIADSTTSKQVGQEMAEIRQNY